MQALCRLLLQYGLSEAALPEIDTKLDSETAAVWQLELLPVALQKEVGRVSDCVATLQAMKRFDLQFAELLAGKDRATQALTTKNGVLEAELQNLRDALNERTARMEALQLNLHNAEGTKERMQRLEQQVRERLPDRVHET